MLELKNIIRYTLPPLIVVLGWSVPYLLVDYDTAQGAAALICGLIAPYFQFFTALFVPSKTLRKIIMIVDGTMILFILSSFNDLRGEAMGAGPDFLFYLGLLTGVCVLVLTFIPFVIDKLFDKSKKLEQES